MPHLLLPMRMFLGTGTKAGGGIVVGWNGGAEVSRVDGACKRGGDGGNRWEDGWERGRTGSAEISGPWVVMGLLARCCGLCMGEFVARTSIGWSCCALVPQTKGMLGLLGADVSLGVGSWVEVA